LCVTAHPIQEHANYGHAEDYEVAELRNYEEIFGEVPPFNDGHPRARGRP
jgi:hypothetical protein